MSPPSEGGLREEAHGDLDTSRARCGRGGLWKQLVQFVQLVEREHARGDTATSTTKPAKAAATKLTISTATVPGLGVILVNAEGRTLYTFAPDKKSKVTCVARAQRCGRPSPSQPAGCLPPRRRSRRRCSQAARIPRAAKSSRTPDGPCTPTSATRAPGTATGQGPEPERRPLVRDHAGRQGDHEEAVERMAPHYDAARKCPREGRGRGSRLAGLQRAI